MGVQALSAPSGFCQCGCGLRAPISDRTRADQGSVKGEPRRYIRGHNGRDLIPWSERVDHVIAGESRTHSDGYVLVYLPMHPSANPTYVYEHRLVLERALGRFLATHEYVHHRNGDRADNRLENLEVMTGSQHMTHHRSGVTDEEVAGMLATGWLGREIAALGVSTHRIVRVGREMQAA